jgi:glycosyltransferase involved in cell wall biosynthesis
MISVAIITKNSSRRISKCLDSLSGFRDIIIADTGSRDKTIEVCKSYGANVVQIPWENNFSEIRTKIESYSKFNYIFWIDDDEVLKPDNNLNHIHYLLKSNPDAICLHRVEQNGHKYKLLRIYRKGSWYWKYPIHEVLKSVDNIRRYVIDDFQNYIIHNRSKRKRKYSNIIKQNMKGYWDDPHMTYMYLNELFNDRNWPECVKAYEIYSKTTGGYSWHRSQSVLYCATALHKEDENQKALDLLESSNILQVRAEAVYLKIKIIKTLGDFNKKINELSMMAQSISLPKEIGYSGNTQTPYVIDTSKYAQE